MNQTPSVPSRFHTRTDLLHNHTSIAQPARDIVHGIRIKFRSGLCAFAPKLLTNTFRQLLVDRVFLVVGIRSVGFDVLGDSKAEAWDLHKNFHLCLLYESLCVAGAPYTMRTGHSALTTNYTNDNTKPLKSQGKCSWCSVISGGAEDTYRK